MCFSCGKVGHGVCWFSEINETFPAVRISNRTRPQDPGGGEVQLTSSQDMAVARPVLQPTSQPIVLRSDDV